MIFWHFSQKCRPWPNVLSQKCQKWHFSDPFYDQKVDYFLVQGVFVGFPGVPKEVKTGISGSRHLAKWGDFDEKWLKMAENGDFYGMGQKMCQKMTKTGIRYRFFPKLQMGRIKIQNVIRHFCPPVYLNRNPNLKTPLKPGLKCQFLARKWPNFDPFWGKINLNSVVFQGHSWSPKSHYLEKSPWIGKEGAKSGELDTFLRKVSKFTIFAILLENTSL